MFALLTVLSLLALIVSVTYRKFLQNTGGIQELSLAERIKRYPPHLAARLKKFFKSLNRKRIRSFCSEKIVSENSGWMVWILYGLYGSSVYLILSGFLYALFVPRGIHGLPLLLHVVAGGVFAVCLPAAVYVKAKDHALCSILVSHKDGPPGGQSDLDVDGSFLRISILFWLIAVSGLFLIVTALASMFRLFSLSTQIVLIAVHRYSALVGLLSSLAFVHFSLEGREG